MEMGWWTPQRSMKGILDKSSCSRVVSHTLKRLKTIVLTKLEKLIFIHKSSRVFYKDKLIELYRLDYWDSLTVIKWHKKRKKIKIINLEAKGLMAPWKLAVRLICCRWIRLILYLDILEKYPRNRSLWLLIKLLRIFVSSGSRELAVGPCSLSG